MPVYPGALSGTFVSDAEPHRWTIVFSAGLSYHVAGAGDAWEDFRPRFAIAGRTAGGPSNIIAYSTPVHEGRAMGAISEVSETFRPRHSIPVRVTHWLITLAFLALLVTGVEIVISHPRFYWGETGNVNTRPLFKLPIPSSRVAVPTGYGYVLPDQNGWSRYLHFEAAWLAVFTGLFYVALGFFRGHFRRNLLPALTDLSSRSLAADLVRPLRFRRPSEEEAWSYNTLQRLTYLLVIFVLFPVIIWTGLAMSPGITSAIPAAVTVLGGQQSARTLHFFVSILLVVFLLVHVFMVYLAGFRKRTGAMITGRLSHPRERT
jgi:thiosulfate reductase cytochrome b subunit